MALTVSSHFVSVLFPLFPLLVYTAPFNLRHFGDGADLAIFILFLPLFFSPPCPSLLLARNHKRGVIRIRNVKRMNAFRPLSFEIRILDLCKRKTYRHYGFLDFSKGSKGDHHKKGANLRKFNSINSHC